VALGHLPSRYTKLLAVIAFVYCGSCAVMFKTVMDFKFCTFMLRILKY